MQNEVQSIPCLMKLQSELSPDSIAITAPGRIPLSYQRLYEHILHCGGVLNVMGIGRNNRVAIVLPNGPEMAVTFAAVASIATTAPLNPNYLANEFDFYLRDMNAKALVVQAGIDSPSIDVARKLGIRVIVVSPLLEAEAGLFTIEGEECLHGAQNELAHPDDTALVLYTSGTTSKPKLVPLTHIHLYHSSHAVGATLGLTASDRCLNVMPLFHSHGLVDGLLSSLAVGASVVCTPGFYSPKFFEWMRLFSPTWYTAVPSIHQTILTRAALNSETVKECPLRLIRSCSSSLPPQVMLELEKIFNAPVIEAYGMTEADQIASNPLPPYQRKIGSVGLAAGPEVAIMDEQENLLMAEEVGEIVIRGVNVMQGYENNPQANQSAFAKGWFRTGDQGFLDSDGYLFITGRLKEIINRGGEKISPREVDEVLMNHPSVAQAVAFAVPDTNLGEEIVAAVVLHDGSTATEREIREFASTRLVTFKIPKHVLIVPDIPKGSTGKIQRMNLAKLLDFRLPDQNGPEADFTAPRTATEASLVEIWTQVLESGNIGIHANFFALGGDSILATQVISRIRDSFQVELSVITLFEMPTVAALASVITQHQADDIDIDL